MIARVAVIAVAVVACAWFALGVRAAHDQQLVTDRVSGPGNFSTATADHYLSLLDSASTLNPDRQLDILRAEVVQRTGDLARETRILQAVVRQAPQEIDAWHLLEFSAARQPAVALDAAAHLRALAPPVPAAP